MPQVEDPMREALLHLLGRAVVVIIDRMSGREGM
jgi:hypothetical protein